MIFGILAFIGFAASIPLAEETKDPRRTIGRAVLLSCLGIGLFYVFTTYAGTVAFGPDKMANFPNAGNGTRGTNWRCKRGAPSGCSSSWRWPTAPSPT